MSNANAAHGDHSNSGWLHTSPGERFKILTPARETDGAYTLLEVIADPQYGVPMHIHDNENEHFIVLEGTMRIANDNRTSEVGAGAAITVNKGVPHAWCNLSEVPLRLLVIFSPGNVEGLFREVAARQSDDIAAILQRFGCRIVGPALLEEVHTFNSPRV